MIVIALDLERRSQKRMCWFCRRKGSEPVEILTNHNKSKYVRGMDLGMFEFNEPGIGPTQQSS